MDFLGCKLCDGLDKLACIWLQLSLIYIVCEIEGGRGGGAPGGSCHMDECLGRERGRGPRPKECIILRIHSLS